MKPKIYLAIALIAAVSLACSFSTVVTPEAPAVNTSSNLYQDDFSNTSSGWTRDSNSGGSMDYADGRYRIYVTGTYADAIASAGANMPANVAIDVDITRNAGTENNDFGVVCRLQDLDNFYFFQISSDGYAVIGKFVNNEMSYLSADSMQKVDGINSGSSMNHVRAICTGSSLYLYANGNLVATASDSTFSSGGDIGLMAGTFDEGGVDIVFDNVVVTVP